MNVGLLFIYDDILKNHDIYVEVSIKVRVLLEQKPQFRIDRFMLCLV